MTANMPPRKARRAGLAGGAKNTKMPVKKTSSGITKGSTKSNATPLKLIPIFSIKSVSFAEEDLSDDLVPFTKPATTESLVIPALKVIEATK
jgi:hypothetical protein